MSYTHLSASDGIAQPSLDQSFGYDENDRITSITTVTSSWAISYDANGNRTGVTLNGNPSVYTTEATSNRLASITNPARSFGYDNAGNTTTDSPNYTATYGLSGSLASITRAGITGTYSYDANKRRIRKVTSAGATSTIIFVYDLDGHLLGEYNQSGQAMREYLWLGDTPVAMFLPDPANATGTPQVFYIHTDHLDTPRLVMDMQGHKRWRWLAEPFGTRAPEIDPDDLGPFTQNLRFPGEYADLESGLFYNYFRNYDGAIGRYSQSDPIGLGAGINTYAYVDGNPITGFDSEGLANGGAAQMWMKAPERCKEDDCLCKCFEEYLGLETAAGAGIVAGGLPLVEKRFTTPGSSPATSIISQGATKALGNTRLPVRLWAPTWVNPAARTASAARLVGRWIPGVGWVLLTIDGYQVYQCKVKCEDDKCAPK